MKGSRSAGSAGTRRAPAPPGESREIVNVRIAAQIFADGNVLARVLGVSFSELVELALGNEIKALERGPDEVRRAFSALKSLDAARPAREACA